MNLSPCIFNFLSKDGNCKFFGLDYVAVKLLCASRSQLLTNMVQNRKKILKRGSSAKKNNFYSNVLSLQIQLSKPIPLSPCGEEQVVVVPILHEIQNNTVQQAEVTQGSTASSSEISTNAAIVSATLKRWNEMTPRTGK